MPLSTEDGSYRIYECQGSYRAELAMSDFLTSLLSGGVSGAIECAICQPFDMIKTRHQINRGKNPSTWASLRTIYQEGGVFRFYRGVLPELAGMVPKSSSMYAAYDASHKFLASSTSLNEVIVAFLAGVASGPAEALIVQPFQVVKVRMQAKEHLGRYRSSFDCAAQMLRTEGALAFFTTGFGTTIWRNTVWNALYFGSMAHVRSVLERHRAKGAPPLLGALADLATGFGCGVLATVFNAPFDLAKSRQQSQLPGATAEASYGNNTLSTLRRVSREEGFLACWNGFGPKSIRMGLAGLVGLKSFELTQWMLGAVDAKTSAKAARGEDEVGREAGRM